MENLKAIKDAQLAYKLDGLWHKLYTMQINQKHFNQTESHKELVNQILNEVLELRDQIRTKIYLTELEKENN